jgi:hypothetical protein
MEARTWTLRAEESDGVMRAELEPNERERVVLQIPRTCWTRTDLERAANLMREIAETLAG